MVGRDDQKKVLASVVVVTQEGRKSQKFYYRILKNQVLLVSLDRPDSPLGYPEVILKAGDGPQTWQDERNTGASIDPQVMHIDAKSEAKPARFLFGQSRAILEATFDASVGGKDGVQIHQVADYASGVGLVEMRETTKVKKDEQKRTLTLVKFEPPPTSEGI